MMLWDHGHPYIQSTPVLCDILCRIVELRMRSRDLNMETVLWYIAT